MVDKKNVTPLGLPSDDGSFSSIQREFENCYDSFMDSSFAALGRTITLHLAPEKTIDTSGIQAAPTALHYSPFGGRAPRRAPSTISTVRQTAVTLVHRDVEYTAHIKHGPKDEDDTGGVSLETNEVLTTTLMESLPHINEARTATIDGRRYEKESTRKIGFQDVRYVMTKWKEINEQENG
jgi:hypothetical protein